MCVSPNGNDFEINEQSDQGRRLDLRTAKSGHITLPISGYGWNYLQENHDDPDEEMIPPEEASP